MAQNETSVSGDVVWQDGDNLSETNLARTVAKSNQTDYVERGLTVTVDSAAGTIDVGSGHVTIQDGINAYEVYPNQQTDVSLPAASGVNYVYVSIDPATDDSITLHVDDDDTPPSTPSLKIATADGGAGTATQLNRGPVGDFQTVEIGGATVIQSDGVVARSALPDLAITQTDVVADKTARLALDAEEGDVAIQQDTEESYIFKGGDPSNDSDWAELVTDPGLHAASHEKGGSDELTTFGSTTHDSVSTDEADITGETYVEASRSTGITGIGSGTNFTNIVDTEGTDNIGEFDQNSNARFNPNETGIYMLFYGFKVDNVSDQDEIDARLYDVDGGNVISEIQESYSSGTTYATTGLFVENLTAGINYEIQVADRDSSFDLVAARCFLRVIRSVVHP